MVMAALFATDFTQTQHGEHATSKHVEVVVPCDRTDRLVAAGRAWKAQKALPCVCSIPSIYASIPCKLTVAFFRCCAVPKNVDFLQAQTYCRIELSLRPLRCSLPLKHQGVSEPRLPLILRAGNVNPFVRIGYNSTPTNQRDVNLRKCYQTHAFSPGCKLKM